MTWTAVSFAESGGQVFFRGGSAFLASSRGGEVFTDTLGLTGTPGVTKQNNDKGGYDIGAGLDLALMPDPWLGNTLLGEVMVDYARFSGKRVTQATSVLVNNIVPAVPVLQSRVTVSEMAVVIAPKYRFEFGNLRPWIIPIGLAFLVNSPPSNDVTVLDFGPHFAAGIEYRLLSAVSIGADFRYNLGVGQSSTETRYGTVGGYVGVNF
jgi:hypothetical protein